MTELHNDHAQIANNEGAYIPMEEVDAALRRIERDANTLFAGSLYIYAFKVLIREERERLGLPKEVKA